MFNPSRNLPVEQKEQHHGAGSMNEFYREIQQSKNTAYYVSQCSAAIENSDIWDAGEVFILYTTSRCELSLL